MARSNRTYPQGKFRIRAPKNADSEKRYPIDIQYTWNLQMIRRSYQLSIKYSDWDPNLNNGRGGVKTSFGQDARRVNAKMNARLEEIDSKLEAFAKEHPDEITPAVIKAAIDDMPMTLEEEEKGMDFVDFCIERLKSEYDRNRIGRSRYENGVSGMNIFRAFLHAQNKGTYRKDGIYLTQISVRLIEEYISWRREYKHNSDHTINHALTPITKACSYAAESGLIDPRISARIQDLRITPKVTYTEDDDSSDRTLTQNEMNALLQYYKTCKEPRRKEFIEMFIFAFHACGLRVVDVMTLQWSNVDFKKKELSKVMIKTSKRHIIPLNAPAIDILQRWYKKRGNKKFVFDLVKDNLDIDDSEALYKARNNATKCINQSLVVVGEEIGLTFNLSMHAARHTFAVLALNKGLSMSVVSRLLGHASTDVTEKVYAKFLPDRLTDELNRLRGDMDKFTLE